MGPELHLEHFPIDVLVLHVTHFDHHLVLPPPGRGPSVSRQRDSAPVGRKLGHSQRVGSLRGSYRELVWENHAQNLLVDHQVCSPRWPDRVRLLGLQAGVIPVTSADSFRQFTLIVENLPFSALLYHVLFE